jgi:hypothetical protein
MVQLSVDTVLSPRFVSSLARQASDISMPVTSPQGESSTKRARATLKRLPELSCDVWGRVLEFLLVVSNPQAYLEPGACASGDAIIARLEEVLASYSSTSAVCRMWNAVSTSLCHASCAGWGPEDQDGPWRRAFFGEASEEDESILEATARRLLLLKSFRQLSRVLIGASVDRKGMARAHLEATLRELPGTSWPLHIEVGPGRDAVDTIQRMEPSQLILQNSFLRCTQFAGLFWNHAQPPVEELGRLEGYCTAILDGSMGSAESQRDEEMCTSVASAMEVRAVVRV